MDAVVQGAVGRVVLRDGVAVLARRGLADRRALEQARGLPLLGPREHPHPHRQIPQDRGHVTRPRPRVAVHHGLGPVKRPRRPCPGGVQRAAVGRR